MVFYSKINDTLVELSLSRPGIPSFQYRDDPVLISGKEFVDLEFIGFI